MCNSKANLPKAPEHIIREVHDNLTKKHGIPKNRLIHERLKGMGYSATSVEIDDIINSLSNPVKAQITYSPSAISDGRGTAPQKNKPGPKPHQLTPAELELRTLNNTRKRNARKAHARKLRARQEA